MNFLELLVCAAGITFGIQHKVPFFHGKFKFLDSMLSCTYCTGFHAGWMSYALYMYPSATLPNWEMLLFAFGSAIFSYALDEGIKFLEEAANGDDD